MIPKIQGSKRIANFDKPSVWSIMTPLANETQSLNLVKQIFIQGQGFPSYAPPDFFL